MSEVEPVGAGVAPPDVKTFSDTFADTDEIFFQIMSLGGSTYLWMGNEEARQDNLALGVPQNVGSAPASGTTLMGTTSDEASKTMAQRLAKKLGQPVFVSMNLKDDVALRAFAERRALSALLEMQPGAVASAAAAAAAAAKPKAATADAAGTAASASSCAAAPDEVGVGARTYEVFEEKSDALGARASAMLLDAAKAAIGARGKFSVALSGGSIPKLLAPSLLAAAASAQFDKWHIFLADERYVALSHADSNLGEGHTRLLDQIAIPKDQIYPLRVDVPLEEAARDYEAELRKVCGGGDAAAGGAPPVVDALVLGMGPDGHTASLFPGHPLLEVADCWVAPISDSPKPPPQRITLTLPALNAARLGLFVVTGGAKAPMVKDAFSPEPHAPAGLVLASVRTHWLLDAPAAAELRAMEESQADLYG